MERVLETECGARAGLPQVEDAAFSELQATNRRPGVARLLWAA